MQKYSDKSKIYRIIDANFNRAKEGLRVCEEVARFILDSRLLTAEFKEARHKLDSLARCLPATLGDLLEGRSSAKDVGMNIYINELKRKDIKDIFFANMQRVKESVRVLEEFTKLYNKGLAIKFKAIRYGIYETEKRAAKRVLALSDHK